MSDLSCVAHALVHKASMSSKVNEEALAVRPAGPLEDDIERSGEGRGQVGGFEILRTQSCWRYRVNSRAGSGPGPSRGRAGATTPPRRARLSMR
jgi:hypothetical protein